MKRRVALVATGLALAAATANAATLVDSADDLCSAATDPCIVSSVVEVAEAATLDFGLRALVVAQGGRLDVTRASILCGRFLAEGPASRTAVRIADDAGYGRSIAITARRACSLNTALPCLGDATCAQAGAGSCTAGTGTVTFEAKIEGNGPDSGFVTLRGAGDVRIAATIALNGTGPEGRAGSLKLESFLSDVVVGGAVNIHAAPPQGNYEYGNPFPPGYSGYFQADAGRDVLVQRPVDMSGGHGGGDVEILAGRDIVLAHNVNRDGQQGWRSTWGGDGRFFAGRDLRVEPHGPTQDETFITANAGNQLVHYGYGINYWESGRGGYTWLGTGRDFIVAQKTHVQSNSPKDSCGDGVPIGGQFEIEVDGRFILDGSMEARASGRCGSAGSVYLRTYGDASVGPLGLLDLRATDGAGHVSMNANGDWDIDGHIDLRGETYVVDTEYDSGAGGEGGSLWLEGDDIRVGGRIQLSGIEGSEGFEMYGCRVRLRSTARIHNDLLPWPQYGYSTASGPRDGADAEDCDYGDASYNSIHFAEQIIAEPGSQMTADCGSNHLNASDGAIPPLLLGTIDPPPDIEAGSGRAYCAPCGNGRVEPGESCDDGNITDGDGCTRECVNEGCIAETPGFPGIALCDDDSECTNDRCDAIAGRCVHEPSCSDEIACTTESCQGSSCNIVPHEEMCDDANACTDDMCNAETGCVHAALVGTACEDGDLCSASATCDGEGICRPDADMAAERGRIRISLRPHDDDDVMSASLLLADEAVPQAIQAALIEGTLFDSHGNVLLTFAFDGVAFELDPQTGDHLAERPDDLPMEVRLERSHRGGTEVHVMAWDQDLSRARGAESLGVSVRFGGDPPDGCAALRATRCRTGGKGSKIACRG